MSDLEAYLSMWLKLAPAPSLPSFLLAHGRPFSTDHHTYRGRRSAAKQCFSNAFHLVEQRPQRLVYAEGYIAFHGVPIHHAWTVGLDGVVVDPTLRVTRDEEPPLYFGVSFKLAYVRRTILTNGVYGLLNWPENPTLPDLIEGRVADWMESRHEDDS